MFYKYPLESKTGFHTDDVRRSPHWFWKCSKSTVKINNRRTLKSILESVCSIQCCRLTPSVIWQSVGASKLVHHQPPWPARCPFPQLFTMEPPRYQACPFACIVCTECATFVGSNDERINQVLVNVRKHEASHHAGPNEIGHKALRKMVVEALQSLSNLASTHAAL